MFTRSNKNKILFIVIAVAVTAVLVSAGTVIAGGGWHGGGHRHGGWGWGWPYYGPGFSTGAFLSYPYYYPYQPYYSYYPYYPYAYAPAYSPSPRVIVRERKPAMNPWYYYCKEYNSYYPYVRRCPGRWEKVPAVPRPSLPQPSASIIDKMTLRVNFDVDRASIRLSDKASLDKAVGFVKKYPMANIELYGYTDDTGTEAHNLLLSERRAQAVKQYLVKEAGIEQSQILAFGRGESNPIADNKTVEGRFENRRVEILIRRK